MAKKWHILFCDGSDQWCPVSQFLDSCKQEHQIKILHILGVLEEMGPNLPRPYADILTHGIHELRVKLSGEQVRILYFFCFENFIIMYNVFNKNADRVPEKFIHETEKYREQLLKKLNRKALESMISGNP